jgi:hypothetical protein
MKGSRDMAPNVEKLEAQMTALEERLKRAKAVESARERKADNKRKFLLGAMLIEWMEEDASIKDTAMTRLDSFLTRASDRRFFGIAPKSEPKQDESAA